VDDDHAFLELADDFLRNHVSEGASDSKVGVFYLLCELVPVFLDFLFVTFRLNGYGVGDGLLSAEEFNLIFAFLFFWGVMSYKVCIRIVFI
jgi:hypothetical protein